MYRITRLENRHILCTSPQCTTYQIKLLVDTGAELNIIKITSLEDHILIDTNKQQRLQGITNEITNTIGSTWLDVLVGKNSFKAEFFVVDSDFPIPGDGIVGEPFLMETQAVIDIGQGELSFPDKTTMELRARCETLVPVCVNDPEMESKGIIIHAQPITDNVSCGNVLNNIINQQLLISVINTSDEACTINIPKLEELAYEIVNEASVKHVSGIKEITINQSDRIEQINKTLRMEHMSTEEREAIQNLCHEFSDVFYLDGDRISCTNAVYHEIKTPGVTQPIHQKPYRLPYSQKEEISKQVEEMQRDGIIRQSDSPWNAPLLVVPKKEDASGTKKYRVVVDFRKLNNVTVGDAFPMPNVTEILDQLGKAKYFTCLDMASGYHQIPLQAEDRQKTGFSTDQGHFEFERMCFGLKGAPATFQRMMNRVLVGLNGIKTFVYLDDVIIIGTSLEDHQKQLKEVFGRLRKYNLKLQPLKCEFLRKEVAYLGHIITDEGVKPDPKTTECVTRFPVPKNQKDVKSFLGLAGYYRRFIKNFSQLTKPLTNLLKKDAEFIWNDLCQNAFVELKELLVSKPLLQYPDFSRPFIVTTDASNVAIGAILSQGNIGGDLPIAYISRTLNKAEKNYNTTEKELLAIVWATKQFRPYLFGRRFTIVTDHKPLTWLFNVKDPGARLVRWRLQLEEHEYDIVYKPGTANTNSDALSRIAPINSTSNVEEYPTNTYEKYKEDIQTKVIVNANVVEVEGDLFEATEDFALGHCVSKDFKMSQGVALEFRRRFGQVDKLIQQNKSVTEITAIKNNQQYLLYMINKEIYHQKPTYETMFYTIKNLRQFCETENIKKVALPRIGSGHDRLDWEQVRTMIRYIFRNSKIKVLIFNSNSYSNEEKQNIIEEFHSSPLGGHQGVSRTIKRIKMHHSWKGLKKDVITYIKSCASCQFNKSMNHTIQQPMVVTSTANVAFEKIFLDIVGPIDKSRKGNSFILTIQDDLSKFSTAIPLADHTANTIAKAFVENFICHHGIPKAIVTDQGPDFMSRIFTACCKLLQIKKINTTAYHPQANGALERSHRTLAEYLRHYVSEKKLEWDEYVPYAMFTYNSTIHSTTKFQPYELVYGYPVEVPHTLTRMPQPCYNYEDYTFELRRKLQESSLLARENLITNKTKSKTLYDKNQHEIVINVGDRVLLKNHNQNGKLNSKWKGPYVVTEIHNNENVTILRGRKEIKVHKNELKIFHS